MKIMKKSKRRGFTLIELMVVLGIIGGLMLMVILNIRDSGADEKLIKLKLQSDPLKIKMALKDFYDDCGRYPSTDEGLKILVSDNLVEDGCPKRKYFSKKDSIKDPWHHIYRYEYDEDNGYRVFTYGADNKKGGTGQQADVELCKGY